MSLSYKLQSTLQNPKDEIGTTKSIKHDDKCKHSDKVHCRIPHK